MKLKLLALVFALMTVTTHAQTSAPTEVTVTIYDSSSNVVARQTVPITPADCAVPDPGATTPPLVNPTSAWWHQSELSPPGVGCQINIRSVLDTVPPGLSYTATLIASNAAGDSPESAVGVPPFDELRRPSAPQGLVLLP